MSKNILTLTNALFFVNLFSKRQHSTLMFKINGVMNHTQEIPIYYFPYRHVNILLKAFYVS